MAQQGRPPPILILDGGLGTTLEDHHAVTFDAARPLWSSHLMLTPADRATLLACQTSFAATARVDVLLTATYQVSLEGFAATTSLPDHPAGIPREAVGGFLEAAVRVGEQAAAAGAQQGRKRADLALSLGPYGACMVPGQEYSGRYDGAHDGEDALAAWHEERLRVFVEGVDGLLPSASAAAAAAGEARKGRVRFVAFETVPRRDEVRAVRRAIGAVAGAAHVDFWVSCVFPGAEGDDGLPDGSSVEEVVEAMLGDVEGAARPWGVGINCTKIWKVPRLIERFEAAVRKMVEGGQLRQEDVPALVLYPDGTNGEVYNTTTKKWEKPQGLGEGGDWRESWESQLANAVKEAQKRGCFKAFLVGGCCKASHLDIKRLREEFYGPDSA